MRWRHILAPRLLLAGLLGSGLLTGCAEELERRAVSLVEPASWSPLAATEDPFTDAPADAACPPESYGPEGSFFEVETGLCSYASFAQPSLFALSSGDPIRLVLWWEALVADTEAQAHLAFWLGDQVLLDEWIPIPDPGGIRIVETTATSTLARASPIIFHLHNHGTNNWVVGELIATTEVPVSTP